MSTFAAFLVEKLKVWQQEWGRYDSKCEPFPIEAIAGIDWGGMTGSDPPDLEIDWDKLQESIAKFEAEFRAGKAS